MGGAFSNSAVWHAAADPGADSLDHRLPFDLRPPGPGWMPLGQSWLKSGPEAGFQPGWARIRWTPAALHYDAHFVRASPRNRARTLNERTWELGDICEVFVELAGGPGYVELHVTPENQRLQLLWRPGAFERFSAGEAPLTTATVADPAWVRSGVEVAGPGWSITAALPARALGLTAFSPELALRTAVCRYDCGAGGEPVRLSSTAPLTFPSYHRREEWHLLVLDPIRSRP